MKYECWWSQFFENLIMYKFSLGSREVQIKIWAWSVQPFWRLLDTNRQTASQVDKQRIKIYIDNKYVKLTCNSLFFKAKHQHLVLNCLNCKWLKKLLISISIRNRGGGLLAWTNEMIVDWTDRKNDVNKQNNLYNVYHVQCIPCKMYTMYNLFHVQYIPCTMYTLYNVYHSQCIPCTMYTMYNINIMYNVYHVQCIPCTMYTMYNVYHV